MNIYFTHILVILYGLECEKTQQFSAQNETFQNCTVRIRTDYKMTERVKITTFQNGTNLPSLFDTICSRTLKLVGYIKRSNALLAK